MTDPQMLAWGTQRYRVGAWHAEEGTALLAPNRTGAPQTPAMLSRCLDHIAELGYRAVVTSALNEHETPLFVAAGFRRIDELAVLRHDLAELPTCRPVSHRRGQAEDLQATLAVDAAAFPPAWQLDGSGLEDAISATRSARWRVIDADDVIVAYSVSGRTGRDGFLQRLAVHPECTGQGIGTALVADCLRWNRRWRARTVLVNTQTTNERALDLYRRCGFERTQPDLHVLRAELQ